MSGTQVSVKGYDGNIHGESDIFGTRFPASIADLKEKEKQNKIDHRTETVETLTSDLKSGDAVGFLAYEIEKGEKHEEVATGIMTEYGKTCDVKSRDAVGSLAYEIDEEEKDEEVVTGILTEHGRTESMLEMNKSEFLDTEKKEQEISHCLSNCGELEKADMVTMSEFLVSEKNEVLAYKQNKGSNSWEYASSGKECTDLSTSQASVLTRKVKVSEVKGKECTDLSTRKVKVSECRKVKVSESMSNRRPQKRQSMANIIASQTRHPESSNNQTEESKPSKPSRIQFQNSHSWFCAKVCTFRFIHLNLV